MTPRRPCFLEPVLADERPGLRRETLSAFLGRSTWRRAAEIRAFYNDAIAALPDPCGDRLCALLRSDNTEAPTFELIVGRFLQLRGAVELECEPQGARHRVDWRAGFPDGVLHVEAMVPVYNAGAGVMVRRRARLLDVLEQRAPEGWWLMPLRMPRLDESAPVAGFKSLVAELLADLPPAEEVEPGVKVQLAGSLPEGSLEIAAVRATRRGGLGTEGVVAYYDNSELRIKSAWRDRRKRAQGRSVPPPALLALQGGFAGADLDDFENALFGPDARRGAKPDGVMAVDRDSPWAGVLAFPRVTPAGADDPVLFVAPAYTGSLPAAVGRLEVRRLESDRVTIERARDTDVMAALRWATP